MDVFRTFDLIGFLLFYIQLCSIYIDYIKIVLLVNRCKVGAKLILTYYPPIS